MFLRFILYLFIRPLIEGSVYLYNTHDNTSVEFYDCIIDTKLPYCRRPSEPIYLSRDQFNWYCDHGGIAHNFSSLYLKNISVSTLLHEWSSSIEKVEEYARYRKQQESNEKVSTMMRIICANAHTHNHSENIVNIFYRWVLHFKKLSRGK